MRGHVAIITKPSPHYVPTESTISGRDVVLIPGLLPIFLQGCEIKSGWGLGTRLVCATFSVILHFVDTADKMSLNSNTNYLDSSLVPIVYRSLMFVTNLVSFRHMYTLYFSSTMSATAAYGYCFGTAMSGFLNTRIVTKAAQYQPSSSC